jgi:acetyl-CoA carboxylase carboxyltransferase component
VTVGPENLLAMRSGVKGTAHAGFFDHGGRVAVFARVDGGTRRGALARRDGETLAVAAGTALRLRLPLVLELASSGADVSEGLDALHGWGGAAAAVAACSGHVPVVGVVTGPVVSGPALMLGLCDLVVMNAAAVAFVSGPAMVAAFTGMIVDAGQLGGVAVHAGSSGLCAVETEDLAEAVAELLAYLPDHADAEAPPEPTSDPSDRLVPALRSIVPDRDQASYDVRDVARALVDDEVVTELWPRFAPQLVTAFGRIAGRSVGIVANQPRALAGTLDISASQKGARFVGLCDAFNLPIVTLVDTPGFLPGKDLEWRGMIRHGAELAFSYAEATVPRICVILRKAFGGAYIVMDSKGIGNDVCVAWPGAEVAVMGAAGAVQILHRRSDEAQRKEQAEEYRERFLTPWPASERGLVDLVIDPAETRAVLAASLAALATKREVLIGRKHGSGPL